MKIIFAKSGASFFKSCIAKALNFISILIIGRLIFIVPIFISVCEFLYSLTLFAVHPRVTLVGLIAPPMLVLAVATIWISFVLNVAVVVAQIAIAAERTQIVLV